MGRMRSASDDASRILYDASQLRERSPRFCGQTSDVLIRRGPVVPFRLDPLTGRLQRRLHPARGSAVRHNDHGALLARLDCGRPCSAVAVELASYVVVQRLAYSRKSVGAEAGLDRPPSPIPTARGHFTGKLQNGGTGIVQSSQSSSPSVPTDTQERGAAASLTIPDGTSMVPVGWSCMSHSSSNPIPLGFHAGGRGPPGRLMNAWGGSRRNADGRGPASDKGTSPATTLAASWGAPSAARRSSWWEARFPTAVRRHLQGGARQLRSLRCRDLRRRGCAVTRKRHGPTQVRGIDVLSAHGPAPALIWKVASVAA